MTKGYIASKRIWSFLLQTSSYHTVLCRLTWERDWTFWLANAEYCVKGATMPYCCMRRLWWYMIWLCMACWACWTLLASFPLKDCCVAPWLPLLLGFCEGQNAGGMPKGPGIIPGTAQESAQALVGCVKPQLTRIQNQPRENILKSSNLVIKSLAEENGHAEKGKSVQKI